MSIRYDPSTALVVVDMQNDFADPAGSLYVSGGEEVIEPINREISRARDAGATVIYTQDWHPESTPHFEKDGGLWPVHCVAESWGSELHPLLVVDGPKVRKGIGTEDGYSGFTSHDVGSGSASRTGLEELLRERAIERVVVVGLALDYCVKATALDARAAGFETVLVRGATRAVDLKPGDGAASLVEVEAAGVALA